MSKATGLAYIGGFLGETGDTVGAREVLNKALQITTAFQDSSQKDGALWQIGGSQAKTGDIKEALHTAAQIQSAYYKVATLSLIAEAQAKAGNKSDAKQTIAQALRISDEETVNIDGNLAWIAAAQSRIGDLKEALLTAVRIEYDGSFEGDKIREIVEAQIKAKNLKGALQAAHIIKDASKKGQALSIVAIAQADSGDILAAKITISEALVTVNLNNNELDDAHILGNVAEAQVKIGDQIGANKTHAAILLLAENIRRTIDSDSTLSDRAAIFAITGDIERALRITSSIHDDFHKQWALTRIADAQTKRGEIEGAIKTVSLIPNGNDKIRILMDIARLIHHRYSEKNGEDKSKKSAIIDLTKSIELNSRVDEVYFDRGVAWVNNGDYEKAIADFTNAIELNPRNERTFINRGVARFKKGDYDSAIFDFTRAIELNPQNAAAYTNRGMAKGNNGDHDGGIVDFNRAIELSPQDAKAYYNRGVGKGYKGDYDGAIRDYDKAIELNPKNEAAYANRDLARIRDIEGAIEKYIKAIKLNPRNEMAYTNRGLARDKKGDLEGAISDYTNAIYLNPDYWKTYFDRGKILDKKGEYDRAISDFTKSIELNPNNDDVFTSRGLALFNRGNFDGSIEDYTHAIALNSRNDSSYNNRGLARHKKGEFEKAISDYSKAIEINPNKSVYYSNRGYTEYKKKDYEQALNDIDSAVILDPTLPASYSIRAWIMFAKGDDEGAMEDLIKFFSFNRVPNSAFLNRGLQHYLYGEYDQAIDAWNQANSLEDPDRADLEPLIRKAEKLSKKDKK